MQQAQIDDLGFCPSFSCYSSDSLASTAAGKISTQLQQQKAATSHDSDEEDEQFEFSFILGDEELPSVNNIDFPLFNGGSLVQNEVDRKAEPVKIDEKENASTTSLEKLFITRSSSSSSSSDSSDGESPGVFCVWRYKNDVGSSPLSKCKKSSSTGSGSKRWRIRDLLRRSNSDGKDPMTVLTDQKKVENTNQKGGSGKSKPSIHELMYVQQRAKRQGGTRKSYLPYRQGLVGFFTNVNGSGKKL